MSSEQASPNPGGKRREPVSWLPEGMGGLLLEAADRVRAATGTVRVITHYDGDGISAGAVLFTMLQRLGKRMHISFIKGLNEASWDRHMTGVGNGGAVPEPGSPVIFADMGANRPDLIAGLGPAAIVLDHHVGGGKFESGLVINCRDWDIDGSDQASGATLAFLLACAVDEYNWDLFDMALVGIIADRQHMGGLKGLNRKLAGGARKEGVLKTYRRLRIMDRPLDESLSHTMEPVFRPFFGDEEAAAGFLEGLGISKSARPGELDGAEAGRLGSALALELLRQGARPEFASDVMVTGYGSRRYDMDIEEVSHAVNACGREGEMALGMSACLGDDDALVKANALRGTYRRGIREGLERILAGGVSTGRNIQHFESKSDEHAGALAGLAMMFLLDSEMATISYSRVGDELKVSGRGTAYLVERRGLDLARALEACAAAVGGSGGGHPVASGATIPAAALGKFLEALDEMVGRQMGADPTVSEA